MSALERTSSMRRLVQRLTNRKHAPEAHATSTHVISEHIQQQRSVSSGHSRHDSHFSHLELGTNQVKTTAISNQAREHTANGWDFSEEPLDNNAVELTVDDRFITGLITEGEWIRPLNITKRSSRSVSGHLPDTSPTESSCSAEDDNASDTVHDSPSSASADNISLPEELSGHYFLALDAYNSDPLPFEDICPIVIEYAAQQLDEFDWSKLKRRRCLEQCGNDLRTLRWSQDVKSEKFACWTCSMTKESVCIRWLGGNAFLILPLLPRLRKPDTGPESLEYWVWGGPT